jgi:hypothetical protein
MTKPNPNDHKYILDTNLLVNDLYNYCEHLENLLNKIYQEANSLIARIENK